PGGGFQGGGFQGGGFQGGGQGTRGGGFGGGQGPRGGVGGPGVAPGGGAAPPGNRQSRADGEPDFFAQPVMDDRRTLVLFDPQATPRLTEFASAALASAFAEGRADSAEGVEEQQAPPPAGN